MWIRGIAEQRIPGVVPKWLDAAQQVCPGKPSGAGGSTVSGKRPTFGIIDKMYGG